MVGIVNGAIGESLAERATKYSHCNGQDTGIMKVIPLLIAPYTECGGLLGLTNSDTMSPVSTLYKDISYLYQILTDL